MSNPDETLDLRQFFPYRLSVLQQRVSRAIAQHYHDRFDLSRIEWRVMATLAMFDGIAAKDICDFTQMAKMQVSRALTRMKKNELVVQQVNDSDHRTSRLSLTERGRSIYRQIVPMVKIEELEILARLSEPERKQLLNIMTKLEKALG